VIVAGCADLHPGNILVRVDEKNSSMPTTWLTQTKQRLGLLPSEHVVLLDVGMVAELSREDQINLIGFFKASYALLPPLWLL
jgi:aarF domain-containing kinase